MALENKEKSNTSKSSMGAGIFINEGASSLGKLAEKFRKEIHHDDTSRITRTINYLLEEKLNTEITKIQDNTSKENEEFRNEFLEKLKEGYRKDIENKTKSFETKIDETRDIFEQKIDSSRIKIIETLGIFVALFTFVSVEFQMFRIFHTPSSIGGLTLILLGSLISFLLVLDFVINSSDNIKTKFYPMVIFSVGFILIGIFIFIKSPQERLNIDNEANIENQGSSLRINQNSIALPQK